MQGYPVVKTKHLRNYKVGDIVCLKKTGKLVKISKYAAYTGSCKRCVFNDQCDSDGEFMYKTGCDGFGEDFGGNSVYFLEVKE